MGKCFIDFSVIQQDLRRTDKNTVAADAAETVAARFDLGNKWDGLNVYARFQHGPEVYDVPLVDGCAMIPHEVMRETGFNISIFGEDSAGARLTSARVFVDVEPTISNDGAPPIPATPSLLQRIDALVHASSENAYNAAESARRAQEANAATITVDSVDTLPAGSAATVTNVGTAQDARLRFGIPKGDKGDKGSGGMPSGGAVGQVVCKTATGEGWTDANAHNHDASAINAGTLDAQRLPVIPVAKGGTGATTAAQARANIGAAGASHTHNAADIAGGTMPIIRGGTGANTAEGARANLEINIETLGAARADHAHDASEIGGVLPIEHGGTGAETADGARVALGAAASIVGDCITLTNSADTTLGKNKKHIVTDSIAAQKGSSFSVSEGYIVCNFDGTVVLSAGVSMKGTASGDNLQMNVGKGGYAFTNSPGQWASIYTTPVVENVTSGEKIGIEIVNWTSARGDNLSAKLTAIRLS